MVKHRDFSSWVEIKGEDGAWKRCQEYKTEMKEETVSTIIESLEGRQFMIKVCWTDDRPPNARMNDISGCIAIDGSEMSRMISYSHERPGRVAQSTGKSTSRSEQLPYQFAKLQTTDEDEVATKDEKAMRGVGSISVKMLRCTVQGPATTIQTYQMPKSHIFHERSKKANLSYSTGFSQPFTTPPLKHVHASYIDDARAPFVSFEFKYRSRTLLEIQDIVPPLAAPIPATDVVQASAAPVPSRTSISSTPSGSGGSVEPSAPNAASSAAVKVKEEKKVKQEKLSQTQNGMRSAGQIIDIDDDDGESELARLRRENAQLRKKIKVEDGGEKGKVFDLTGDSD